MLNMKDLNTLIKRQRVSEQIRKRPNYIFFTKKFSFKISNVKKQIKTKGMEEDKIALIKRKLG